jgi:hypothetical protein
MVVPKMERPPPLKEVPSFRMVHKPVFGRLRKAVARLLE